jgi:hypothetical protein
MSIYLVETNLPTSVPHLGHLPTRRDRPFFVFLILVSPSGTDTVPRHRMQRYSFLPILPPPDLLRERLVRLRDLLRLLDRRDLDFGIINN